MSFDLLDSKIDELERIADDSLDLNEALLKINEITKIANDLIKNADLKTEIISELYGRIANSYLIASNKSKTEYKFSLAFSSNYWEMLQAQTAAMQDLINRGYELGEKSESKRISEKFVVKTLIGEIGSAQREIKMTCGEAGFLQRNPDLVDSIADSLDRGVDVTIYYLDIQDKEMIGRLNKKGCKLIRGQDYSKLHYLIADDFAYTHTHERFVDRFISNNKSKIDLLKKDFNELVSGKRGDEQQRISDEENSVLYDDVDIISLLIREINSAKTEIYIASGLGILLRESQDLIKAISEACNRGVNVYLYYVYIPREIIKQLTENNVNIKRGVIYPRLHYWIIDNFVYESTHPRQNDQFYNGDKVLLSELGTNFNKLLHSAS